MSEIQFFLGTHRPTWLWELEDVPLFISHRRLRDRKGTFPKATTTWALDSGGFTELSTPPAGSPALEWHDWCQPITEIRTRTPHHWQVTPEQYITDVRRFIDELGGMVWAAPQDWMCEPWIIRDTALTVEDHQRLTVDNFLTLRRLAPDLLFIPVLQGWEVADYHRHADMYAAAGVDLTTEPIVGVGSVCRRESTSQAAHIFETLAARGLKLHGFGVKSDGLRLYADSLVSADSLAWSYGARQDALRGIRHCSKKTCANCLHYALSWRDNVLRGLDTRQLSLFGGAA